MNETDALDQALRLAIADPLKDCVGCGYPDKVADLLPDHRPPGLRDWKVAIRCPHCARVSRVITLA